MSCVQTQDGFVELINTISLYKEEGKSLFPKIFILDDMDILKKELVSFEYIFMGEDEKKSKTMMYALKKCAPLTELFNSQRELNSYMMFL